MKNNQKSSENAAERIKNPNVRRIVMQKPSKTDPNGSYTGHPENEEETPVQDADDL